MIPEVPQLRVLVCGGRAYPDRSAVFNALTYLDTYSGRIVAVIQGGATGVDAWARQWAIWRGFRPTTYEADWQRYGIAAGPIRNTQMVTECAANIAVAFPGARGTRDCVRKIIAAGIPLWDLQGIP